MNESSIFVNSNSSVSNGTWTIPERLQQIPESEDPNFFNMVEYYFHKACILAEDNLVRPWLKMKTKKHRFFCFQQMNLLPSVKKCFFMSDVNFRCPLSNINMCCSLQARRDEDDAFYWRHQEEESSRNLEDHWTMVSLNRTENNFLNKPHPEP